MGGQGWWDMIGFKAGDGWEVWRLSCMHRRAQVHTVVKMLATEELNCRTMPAT